MNSVTISSKFQIVIPKHIRTALRLHPGQKLHVMEYNNRIVLVPEKNIAELRGFLKGINTTVDREEDRQ